MSSSSTLDPEKLQRFSASIHKLDLPTLVVDGTPLTKETVLRTPFAEHDVTLTHCARCEVSIDRGLFQVFTPPTFCTWFATMRHAICTVRLISDGTTPVVEEYRVQFRIPDVDALNAVDAHFLRTLVARELTHAGLKEFIAGVPTDGPACEYADALGNYALGIVLKEGRGQSGFSRVPTAFEGPMRAALEVLRYFHRPVALAVSSSIYFNLNNFRDDDAAAATELEAAIRFFRSIANPTIGNTLPQPSALRRTPRPICPLDHVSHQVRLACDCLVRDGRLSLNQIGELWQLTAGPSPLTPQDLAKIQVICAEGYARLGRPLDALPYLRALQHHLSFGDWAERLSEDLSSDET